MTDVSDDWDWYVLQSLVKMFTSFITMPLFYHSFLRFLVYLFWFQATWFLNIVLTSLFIKKSKVYFCSTNRPSLATNFWKGKNGLVKSSSLLTTLRNSGPFAFAFDLGAICASCLVEITPKQVSQHSCKT